MKYSLGQKIWGGFLIALLGYLFISALIILLTNLTIGVVEAINLLTKVFL